MIRFLFRLIGVLILAAAFVALLYDGTKTIAGAELVLTPLEAIWSNLHAGSLQWLRAGAERASPAWIWGPGLAAVLAAPAALVLGVTGALLILLGRRKKPPIGYAR